MVVRNISFVDGARLAGGEYERQPGSYGWRSCHLLPWPPYMPSFGNHHQYHRHFHQLIIVIAIAIIIKKATIYDKERVQNKWNYSGGGSSDTAKTSPSPLAALPRHSYIGLCRRWLLSGWVSIRCCNIVNAILLLICLSQHYHREDVNIIYHRPPGSSLHGAGGEEGHTSGLSCALSCCRRNILHFSLGRQIERQRRTKCS